jgi:hypothetical protein
LVRLKLVIIAQHKWLLKALICEIIVHDTHIYLNLLFLGWKFVQIWGESLSKKFSAEMEAS